MCIEAIELDPWQLNDIPDYLKTQKMCDDVVRRDPYSLQFVRDWFLTKEQIDVWYYDDEYCDNDDELIEWHNGYKKRKAQKARTKEGILPIAWHSDRVKDWCISEDEKRQWK